MNSLGLLYMLR